MNTYLFKNLKNDFISSIVVFLVAVPLCLGIALASGAPLLAGLLSGIIGGIIVGAISESNISVSGPAAGMIAVVLAAITQLKSYEAFLLALFFAGILQILIGAFRAGFLADYFPSNVIQGLLAAIGILIIIKQLPLALGYFPQTETLKASLKDSQETLNIHSLSHIFSSIDFTATCIALVSLGILIYWDKISIKRLKIIPAAIIVVIVSILINYILIIFAPHLSLDKTSLIHIPTEAGFSHMMTQLKHPDFFQWNNFDIYIYAFMIAIIASLETLLNLEAAEKLDKKHRYCSRNRELVAQGIGNMFAGALGGIPITSVIVRTSVNINSGAKTKFSAMFHGILLLASLIFFPHLLNKIPLSALAAILIYTGYKLMRLEIFKEVYEQGFTYFFPFIVTIVAIVATNLLLGILIGLSTSLFFILRYNSRSCFTKINENHPSGNYIRLILPQQVTFLNKAGILAGLKKIPRNSRVIIDANNTDYIDPDILHILNEFKDSTWDGKNAKKNILLNLEGFKDDYTIQNQTKFINVTTYDIQENLTPENILTILKEGNQRFIKNTPIHKNFKSQVKATSKSQHPIAVILSCIDSRVPVELIFDMTLGDVFVIRIAGNIVNADILASLEFACQVSGAKLIMVLGHTGCGAITAACQKIEMGHLTQLIDKITPAINATSQETSDNPQSSRFIDEVTKKNIDLTKASIYQSSEIIANLLDQKKIGLIGGLYDITTGQVEFEIPPLTQPVYENNPNTDSSAETKKEIYFPNRFSNEPNS